LAAPACPEEKTADEDEPELGGDLRLTGENEGDAREPTVTPVPPHDEETERGVNVLANLGKGKEMGLSADTSEEPQRCWYRILWRATAAGIDVDSLVSCDVPGTSSQSGVPGLESSDSSPPPATTVPVPMGLLSADTS
jgi:hypothetical protein